MFFINSASTVTVSVPTLPIGFSCQLIQTGAGTITFSGNGTTLNSTTSTGDNQYTSLSGTSMASPNVMGTLLLLQQHYSNLYQKFIRSSTLKGLACHTADDAGNAGPDAKFGWGLLNWFCLRIGK